jgi:hypothetical protein
MQLKDGSGVGIVEKIFTMVTVERKTPLRRPHKQSEGQAGDAGSSGVLGVIRCAISQASETIA